MKNNYLSLLLCFLFFSLVCTGQEKPILFNLDFESTTAKKDLPDSWGQWGSYQLKVDKDVVYSGKQAVLIDAGEKGGAFGSVVHKIAPNYKGEKITLEGYMKTEGVADGFAGLLLRIDGESGPLEFDNMQNEGISGDNDWKKYSITLPFPEEATNIFVAGILVGNGKAWYDDFSVFIDGVKIQELKTIEKKPSKAKMDTEFDAGSSFTLSSPSQKDLDRLYLLGKVWGWVKYQHPTIAKGEVNWDYELFRILPAIHEKDFNNQLVAWVEQLGDFNAAKVEPQQGAIKLKTNTAWLSDKTLVKESLRKLLWSIRNAKKADKHYHIGFAANIGNPVFKNEQAYPYMNAGDTGYQLLSLFRYWNMIEYFFPYKHLMDENWDEVLKSSLSTFIAAKDELSYKLATLQLIGKIQDTHANIWQNDGALNQFHGTQIAPIEVNIIENQAVVVRIFNGITEDSNIKIGDIITHINGIKTEEVIAEKIAYCPASNRPTQLRDVARRLLRTNDSSIEVSISSTDRDFKENLESVPATSINFWKKDTPSHKELEGNIGYIYPGALQKGEIHDIMKQFMSKKGLVIDLRCYPSDFIVFSLGNYLMPKPTSFVKFTAGNLQQPGQFTFGATLPVGTTNPDYFKGKVAILINETTQSQAEYTTMALRVAPNTKVIGSTTAAADGNVSEIILPGKIRTMISGIGVYYPDGTETQRVGILPDIETHPTIRGIRAGKDELLQKAQDWIKEN